MIEPLTPYELSQALFHAVQSGDESDIRMILGIIKRDLLPEEAKDEVQV